MYKKPKQKAKHVFAFSDGLLHHNNTIYVPQALRQRCLEEMHDAPYAGHRGVSKTDQAIASLYWWPKMTVDIAHYVKTCIACQSNKAACRKSGGSLQPLPVPVDRWAEVTMDYITGLPCTPRGYDAILVFHDRLTKMVHFAACTKSTDAPATAKLFRGHVFIHHGLPDKLISDRDNRLKSGFWQAFMQLLGVHML